jgi:hypothetical protein
MLIRRTSLRAIRFYARVKTGTFSPSRHDAGARRRSTPRTARQKNDFFFTSGALASGMRIMLVRGRSRKRKALIRSSKLAPGGGMDG